MTQEHPHKILVVGPSWVGDMVMAQSLFKTLRQQQPDVSIDVLAPGWSLPLLRRMPEVADAIDMPLGHGELKLAVRRLLGKSLRGQGYQQAIVLPNSLKSALIPFWAKIPRRTGYVGEMRYGLLNDARRLDKQQLPMTVQRFVALGQAKGATLPAAMEAPSLSVSDESIDDALSRLQLQRPAGKLLLLCPGAEFGEAKRWPAQYYAEVARQCQQQGWQVWLFGSEKDQEVTASINQLAGNGCTDLAGRTRLAEAIDLMSLADVVVSNDSGLMHVAAALNKSLLAIYGSSDPAFTPPLNPEATILRLGLHCSPCFKRECPFGHLNCLKELKPDKVFRAMGIEPL